MNIDLFVWYVSLGSLTMYLFVGLFVPLCSAVAVFRRKHCPKHVLFTGYMSWVVATLNGILYPWCVLVPGKNMAFIPAVTTFGTYNERMLVWGVFSVVYAGLIMGFVSLVVGSICKVSGLHYDD